MGDTSGCQPSLQNLAFYIQGVSVEPSSNLTSEYFVTGTLPSSNAGKRVWQFISQGALSTPPGVGTFTLDYTEAQKQCPDIQVSFSGPINGNLIFYNEVFSAKKYMSVVSTGSVAVMTIRVPPSIIRCKGSGAHPYYFNVNLDDGTSAFSLNYDDTSGWTSTQIAILDISGAGGCSGTCGDFVAYYDSTTDPSTLNVYLDSTYTYFYITATNETSGNATFIVNNCSNGNGCPTEPCLSVTVTNNNGKGYTGTVPPLQPLSFLSTSGGDFIIQLSALSRFYYGTTSAPYALVTLVGTTSSTSINTMVVGAGGASPARSQQDGNDTGGGGGGGVAFSTLDISGTFFILFDAGAGTSGTGQSSQYTLNTILTGTNSPALVAQGGQSGSFKNNLPDGGPSGSPTNKNGGVGTYTNGPTFAGTTGGGGGSYSAANGCIPGNGRVWNDCNAYAIGGNGFAYANNAVVVGGNCPSLLTTPTPSTGNGADGVRGAGTSATPGGSGIIGFQYNPEELLITPLNYYGSATSSGTLSFTFTSSLILSSTILYVLVGGGGGGALSQPTVGGGGGGGGAVSTGNVVIMNSTTAGITITIGAGGTAGEGGGGGDGFASSITYDGETAGSAEGGSGGTTAGDGGQSGNNNSGASASETTGGGGGGSGAATTTSTGGTGTTSYFSGIVYGTGGNGGTLNSGKGNTASSNTGNGGGGGGYNSESLSFGGAGGSGFVEIYYNANDVTLSFVPTS